MSKSPIVAVCLVLAAACAAEDVPTAGYGAAITQKATYLAAGDSIPFGFDPLVLPPTSDAVFAGYPEVISDFADRPHVNTACPGETSGSYLAATARDNGCRLFRLELEWDLHARIKTTQNDLVQGYLATHSGVSLVTYAIGINDLLLLATDCAGESSCIAGGLPAVLGEVGANFATALATMRATYAGQIVVPTYYSSNYADARGTAAIAYLNQVLATVAPAFGAQVVDVFSAFYFASMPYGGSPCAAGLLIRKPDGSCDTHPSPAGDALIAQTILQVAN